MRKEKNSPIGLHTIGIAALFLAGFFLLVTFGAKSYRNSVAVQDRDMQHRAVLAGISTAVRSFDARGAVSVTDDPDYGQVLNLADGDSGYMLRIYLADGALQEEYTPENAALNPASAMRLGEAGEFTVQLNGDLLRVHTDAGSVLMHLRSEAAS